MSHQADRWVERFFFFFKWDNKTFGNLKQPIKLIKFSIFGCVLGSKNKYSLAKCYWFEIQRKTTLPLFNQLLCSSFSVICYWKILTQGCIFAEMRRENKSVSLTKQSLFSRWCLNRRLKTEELHLPTLAISITRSDSSHRRNAYKHMVGCGNSWGNRLTNNDSRRERALYSVALNHNDFDTTGSRVLQATMTTVVSCMLKEKSKHVCVFC